MVDLVLGARQASSIAWRPELTSLYNDGYVPILGAKHPHRHGKRYAGVWSEIWDEYRPVVTTTMASEAQSLVDRFVALADRPGLATSWFTFS